MGTMKHEEPHTFGIGEAMMNLVGEKKNMDEFMPVMSLRAGA